MSTIDIPPPRRLQGLDAELTCHFNGGRPAETIYQCGAVYYYDPNDVERPTATIRRFDTLKPVSIAYPRMRSVPLDC